MNKAGAMVRSFFGFVFAALVSALVLVQPSAADSISTETTIVSSNNPSYIDQSVTFTATVTPNFIEAPTPTGTVNFVHRDSLEVIGTGTLSGGVATFTTSNLSVDQTFVVARYSGDMEYPASESPFLEQQVNKYPVTVTLDSSQNPSGEGDEVTFTAIVTAGTPSHAQAPSGSVEFYVDKVLLGSGVVDAGGLASFTTSSLAVGDRFVFARYLGDDHYNAIGASDIQTVEEVVIQATSTTITSDKNPANVGEAVTFTVTVSSASAGRLAAAIAAPSNVVEVRVGSTLLDTVNLTNGTGQFTTSSLGVGSHAITATYVGDNEFAASTSAPLNQVIEAPAAVATTTTLTSNKNPAEEGEDVTFSVNVSANTETNARAAATAFDGPTNVVEVHDGDTLIGTIVLDNGSGSLTTNGLAVGTHVITATHVGDGSFAASTSAPVNQVINAATVVGDVLGDMQDAATPAVAAISAELITDTVGEQVGIALSNTIYPVSASDGRIGIVYAPNLEKGTSIVPTADVVSSNSMWRFWADLRFTDWDADQLDGKQVNGLVGVTANLGNGVAAGVLVGYETFDYENAVGAILKGDGMTAGAYVGGGLGNGFRFDAQLHGSAMDYAVEAAGAKGDFGGKRMIASGGFAHRSDVAGLIIEPNVRATSTWEWQDAYVDSLSVAHAEQSLSFGRMSGGLKIAKMVPLSSGGSFTPYVQAHGDYRYSSDLALDSALDGFSGRLGAGLDVMTAGGATIGIAGEVFGLGLDNGTLAKSIKASVTVPF